MNEEKGYIWYGLRISFYLMLGLWLLPPFIGDETVFNVLLSLFVAFLWIISAFHTFVLSLLHLHYYSKKKLAIISLIISTILVLIFIYGFALAVLTSSSWW